MPIWPAFKQSPLEALPMVKLRDPLHCTVGDANLKPRITLQVYSDKTSLCSKVDELNKNIFSAWRKQEKKEGRRRSHLWKAEGGSHVMGGEKRAGTGLRSGTARFLMGSLPSAPWEVQSSALQAHEGHHLLQLEGQPLFPGCVVLLQCAHNLQPWGKHREHSERTTFQTQSLYKKKRKSDKIVFFPFVWLFEYSHVKV